MLEPLRPVLYDAKRDVVRVLDQRRLPGAEIWLEIQTASEMAEAIRTLTVRGAPAIGIAAAFALSCEARRGTGESALSQSRELLEKARPTAVNLSWALRQVWSKVGLGPSAMLAEAQRIRDDDEAGCKRIGALGAELLPRGARILTHCNAGALATAGYGTALGIVRAAIERGNPVSVFAGETRPFLQGARLTAWELKRDGIPVKILTDSMAGWLMSRREITCVIVGADRIARNGDVANKIGTYSLAVLAKHHGLPFYVAAPWSTVDLDTPTGASIPIEERSGDEVLTLAGARLAPDGVSARYPAFDVTPAALVTAIVTDRGIARPPTPDSLASLASIT